MQQQVQSIASSQPVIFLPGIFNETLDLLFDAHNYFEARGLEDQSLMPPEHQGIYANEVSIITMRLTSIMAWLMVRKAVSSGKLDDVLASELYRLDGAAICLGDIPAEIDATPYYIGYLSEASRDLYLRIWRLNEMADNQTDNYHNA